MGCNEKAPWKVIVPGASEGDLMKDSEIFPFCRKKGIKLPLAWRNSCNAVRPHDTNETDRHWNYKQAIFRELYKQGYTVFTELEFDYSRIHGNTPRMRFPRCDIFWLDSMIVVELESRITSEARTMKLQQFKDFNCFVVDIQNLTVEDILEKIGAR